MTGLPSLQPAAPGAVAEAAPPPPDLRREPRLCTLFRTGKLLAAGAETICRVRNISSNGFMADACPAPAVGERIALELCEGRSLAATVVWAQPDRFGARFAVARSVSEMIAEAFGQPHHRHRALRVTPKSAFATIVHANHVVRTSILNISQTGLSVFSFDRFLFAKTPREVRIEIDGLDSMEGVLCWTRHGAAGIQFTRPLSFETLAHWLWATALAAGPDG
jgi:hypothetical protein